MNLENVMEALSAFLVETFEIPPDDTDFNEDVHMFDYGYVDSFGAVTIIGFVEKRFGVEITDQDLVIHPLNTVREISTLVVERLGREH